MGSKTGIHTKRYQEPELPVRVTGLSRMEGQGESRMGAPLGALTVAEERDAESWLRVTTGRVGMRFSLDTKLTEFSDKMD